MTMMSAKQVIAGLRAKNKELKDQIEAVKSWFKENEDCIDHDYADEDATARVKLRKILEDPE